MDGVIPKAFYVLRIVDEFDMVISKMLIFSMIFLSLLDLSAIFVASSIVIILSMLTIKVV